MQYSNIAFAAILVLPTTLALPSTGHGHGHHHHGHGPYKSGHVSGAPSASGASGAPYGLSNSTIGTAGSVATGAITGTSYNTLTLQSTIYQTLSSSDSAAPIESATAVGGSGAGSCSAPVTVTLSPTTTVTVTGGAASAEPSVQSSAPVESGLESSASVAGSTVAPVTFAPSSSANPIGLAPNPVPESSSTQPPVSSSASVPSQAATSAVPVVSSTTPVQTSSAAPISSAPVDSATSVPSSTPPTPVSGAASADYCQHTSDPSNPSDIPHWAGQNYTGGIQGSKRGIVYVDGSTPNITGLMHFANTSSNIHWLGNYYSASPPLDSHVEFVPQMYGLQSTNDWNKNADTAVQNGHKHFLSFGEPGTPNAKLYQTSDGAANFFNQYMQPYAANDGVSIGAPGQLGAPQDWKWDEEFLCKCQGLKCSISFIACHWFDKAAPKDNSVNAFKKTVLNYISVAQGKPVWVDNIWASGSIEEQKEFMAEVVPWLESNPSIQRYGWVPQDSPTGTGFVDDEGNISELATYFAGL